MWFYLLSLRFSPSLFLVTHLNHAPTLGCPDLLRILPPMRFFSFKNVQHVTSNFPISVQRLYIHICKGKVVVISNHCCIYTTLEGHDPIFTHNFCCSKSKSVEKTPKPQKQRVFFFRLLHFSFLRIYRTRLQRRQWQSPMQEWMDGHF